MPKTIRDYSTASLLGKWFSMVSLLAVIGLSVPALAQETTSSIRGKVNDSNGSPVASASVVVLDMRNGNTRSYTTNSNGLFLATRLPPGGPYRVTINGNKTVDVANVDLGDTYNLVVDLQTAASMEEVVTVGTAAALVDVAAGPSATYSELDLKNMVSFNRDISDVFAIDPRINLDADDDSNAVNCAGKHPRFNSVTLDGVSQNDRFGLNENGYSTATGMPFPYDALSTVAVELAPFDVSYGGFSACNINAVTKSGGNEWDGNTFYEYSSDSFKGDKIGGLPDDFSTVSYDRNRKGFSVGGPILQDKLFVFAAYESSESPRFLARGYAGSGNGVERPWLDQTTYDLINDFAQNTLGYDTGGQPGDGVQENEKYMMRVDYNIDDNHNAALIYNYFDGFQARDSDGDSDEFEFANHFYTKGAESETVTLKLDSQWNDALSTEVFISKNTMDDSQVTVGPKDFADHQIDFDGNQIYLGADDSRQANALNTESKFYKISAQYLLGNHVLTGGYESDEAKVFNIFVQHSNGGEYDYYDDDDLNLNSPACMAADPQGRLDMGCAISGLDRFLLGRPSQIYYGSAGGTNVATDAAAVFTNTLNSLYLQDEIFFDQHDLTVVAGLRYEWFDSDDRPVFNQAFADINGGLRNDANIDGVDLLMPRVGFTWGAREDLTLRGGVGLYGGGNPTVWLSNAFSNDGVTNVQVRLFNFGASRTILDPASIALSGAGRPGYDVPQELIDAVAATTVANASDEALVILDPNYKQPSELKVALGATWDLPWYGITADVDYLHSNLRDSAFYQDVSQTVIGQTVLGQPIYDYTAGEDNYMLTNSNRDAESTIISMVLRKSFDSGLDLQFGYAYTDAEDISQMSSATAFSNFDNTALLDIQDPVPASSNYAVPHRLTLRASFARDFIGDLQTRITALGYSSQGQPQSFVMSSSDLEGNGRFGRHLLYIPDGPSDPNVDFGPAFQTAEFFDWVAREGFGPGFVARNSTHAKWTTRWDLRIDQEIPTFVDGTNGRAFLKIYNFGNLWNNDWGKVNDAQFFSIAQVDSSIDSMGRYVYEDFNDRNLNDLQENRSLWEAVLGIEINF